MDPEDVARLPEPLHACAHCGYPGIRPASHAEGVFAGGGELTAAHCPRCGHTGLPLVFDRREDYAEFLDAIAEGRIKRVPDVR